MPKTDVLIAGSGSAGIFAATWLSIYNIPFTILERRPGPLDVGQADGVQCRTVEIYESFGLAEELLRESYHVLEVCFWGDDHDRSQENTGKDRPAGIKRKSRSMDTEKGLSHLPHVILNQARMNGLMLEKMEKILKEHGAEERGKIEYGWTVKSLNVSPAKGNEEDPNEYRCEVTAEKDGKEEIWEAKYVLGCDGAHSTIRRALSYPMLGDTSDTVWGVMDIFPITTFPDIRRKCTIHSSAGNLVIIPREGGNMVRFYVQLPPGTNAKTVTLEGIQETARRIFSPYEMEYAGVYWWSAYSIGQRLVEQFHKDHRVFLTGDAAHTHSPKAGQGMNVSLQDGYNIGWKLASVLAHVSPPSILKTYVSERAKTAAELIAFDRRLTELFARKEKFAGEFSEYFVRSGRYMAGFSARYADTEITDGKTSQEDATKGIIVGMRFPSAQVVRFCDAKAVQLQSCLRSDGRWRVVVFGGDINKMESKARMQKLANHLETVSQRFTSAGRDADSVIESLLVLSSRLVETEQESIPDHFWPATGKWKIRDLHKVFLDDEHYNSGHGHAYEKYGVDPSIGAVVIVRPDQYVSKVTTLDDHDGIVKFFEGCMYEQRQASNGVSRV